MFSQKLFGRAHISSIMYHIHLLDSSTKLALAITVIRRVTIAATKIAIPFILARLARRMWRMVTFLGHPMSRESLDIFSCRRIHLAGTVSRIFNSSITGIRLVGVISNRHPLSRESVNLFGCRGIHMTSAVSRIFNGTITCVGLFGTKSKRHSNHS